MKRFATAAFCLFALTACQTPTVYQAAARPDAVGYSDYQIEPGRYRVTFQGGGGAPAQQVEDYALLRAAQVAVRDGYDWFKVTERGGYRAPPRSAGSISIGGGGASFGRGGGVGVGLGTSFPLSGGPAVSRSMEILAGRGPTPHDDGAYDAREVVKNLGPRAHP